MKTAWKTLSVAVALSTGIGIANAATPGFVDGEAPEHIGSHFKKMAGELGLDDHQKAQIRDILKNNRDQIGPLMKNLMTERRAMRALTQADTIDEAAIRAQASRMATLQADLAVERARIGQKVRAVLTPEQIQKFKLLQEKRDKRMDERHAKMQARIKHE
jgi:Spy/CpxP family protein refolding chaperone